MTLYQTYRPTSLDEVVGNEGTVNELRKLLSKDDPPHAYMFQGPHGCGKTTLGRIVATELGVHEQDFAEVDSADFRGIESIRDIRRNSLYRPLRGERRMWLLDECHKLSNDAQNALLKGLEDPPPHCYYVLCTTDPDRVLTTIRSRCIRLTVKILDEKQMVRLLRRVSRDEGIEIGRDLLKIIAERSMGHVRDALQILEKALAVEDDDRERVIQESELSAAVSVKLAQALLGRRGWKAIAAELAKIEDDDAVEGVRQGVLSYCRKVLLGGENETAGVIMAEFRDPFFMNGNTAQLSSLVYACYKSHTS